MVHSTHSNLYLVTGFPEGYSSAEAADTEPYYDTPKRHVAGSKMLGNLVSNKVLKTKGVVSRYDDTMTTTTK
jgi:hypothetical protein